MRSLATRLTLAFLAVGIATVAMIGAFALLRTRTAFDRWEYDRNIISLANMLEDHYEVRGSWDGAEAVLERGRAENGLSDWWQHTPVALFDAQRQVVLASSDFSQIGRNWPAEALRGVPLEVGGATVGWLAVGRAPVPLPDRRLRPEQALLQRVVQSILYGAVGAVAVALILGVVLARTLTRPIRELTAATHALRGGQLGAQVQVHSEDELGQLAASFNQMSADLAQTTELRRQMTADIAHELRTPLSVILGYSEALQDGKLEGNSQTYAALHDAAGHLQRLVDDLRTLALADAGELTLNLRPVDPRALLERCVLAHMAQAQAAAISLELEAATDLPEVSADPDRIAQVLNNLTINALRHTPAGGSIHFSAEQVPGVQQVAMRVRDTGTGISPEDLPHVFDRFYRGDKARQSDEGETGLGLAIARSIIESHGGSIGVESTLGQGTTFTLTLPSG